MGCPAGQIEKFFPPMTQAICMPVTQANAIDEANAKAKSTTTDPTKTNSGLPKWVLDILGNADKIGAGVGAATGKGGATPPPIVYAPPAAAETPAMPQWIWYVVGGVVLIVVVALMRKK